MENSTQDHLENVDLQIDNQVRQQLSEAGRWTKFIAIVMFIACGLLLVFGIAGTAALSNIFEKYGRTYRGLLNLDRSFFIVVIILVIAIIALIYYFLFNFSRKIKNALSSDNTTELNTGLKSLKTFFIISTVVAILSLLSSLYNLTKN